MTALDRAAASTPKASAGGRRERVKALNRQAILTAAREVFAELGYEAAGVRDIIRRTGLASGTFYNYFRSKEEVAKALAADAADRLRPPLEACREQATDFPAYLGGIVRAYFRFICDEHANRGPQRPPSSGPRTRVRFETPAHRAVYHEVESSVAMVVEHGLLPPLDTGVSRGGHHRRGARGGRHNAAAQPARYGSRGGFRGAVDPSWDRRPPSRRTFQGAGGRGSSKALSRLGEGIGRAVDR